MKEKHINRSGQNYENETKLFANTLYLKRGGPVSIIEPDIEYFEFGDHGVYVHKTDSGDGRPFAKFYPWNRVESVELESQRVSDDGC